MFSVVGQSTSHELFLTSCRVSLTVNLGKQLYNRQHGLQIEQDVQYVGEHCIYLFAPCKGIRNPESNICLIAFGIRNPGLWNPESSPWNPESKPWNPESNLIHNSGIPVWNVQLC